MKRTLLLLGVVFGVACSTASTPIYRLIPDPSAPAAIGEVTVRDKAGANNEVTIKVDHLPLPSDLDPALNTYVVWARPPGDREIIPVAEIEIGEDREGKAKLTTPFETFDLLVTAEASATPEEPSEHVVLKGHVDARDRG